MAPQLNNGHIDSIKRELGIKLPEVKSSHRAEAMARGLGFGSNAALRAKLKDGSVPYKPDPRSFDNYLTAHGFDSPPKTTLSNAIKMAMAGTSSTNTANRRQRAWRNMMVAAINAGLEQRLFGLGEDENWWEGAFGTTYRFTIGGMTAVAYVNDISYGELSIHVAVNPARYGEERVKAWNAKLWAGEAFATGWLERKTGKWLQESKGRQVWLRRHIVQPLSDLAIEPQGYADKGKFFL